MKELTFILLLVTSSIIVFGQSDSLHRIEQIEKEVKKIDEELSEVAATIKYDTTYRGQEKVEIYIYDNHIKKIKVLQLMPDSHRGIEFYFDYDRLIFVEDALGDVVTGDSTVGYGYYDFGELFSPDRLIIGHNDTISWGVQMQRMAYKHYDKNKHLLNYNPYKALAYDSVVAYDFMGAGGGSITYKNKLDRTAKNATRFSANQIDSLFAFLEDTLVFGNSTAACFDPHFGIVFYNEGKVVSTINICFGCNYLIADQHLPAQCHTTRSVWGTEYDIRIANNGFSDEGKRKFKWLCGDLGLEYCPDGAVYQHIMERIPKPKK